jgi:hypothetical protein
MTRQNYLSELKLQLNQLPDTEKEAILEYYESYFKESLPNKIDPEINDKNIIKALGTTLECAQNIKKQFELQSYNNANTYIPLLQKMQGLLVKGKNIYITIRTGSAFHYLFSDQFETQFSISLQDDILNIVAKDNNDETFNKILILLPQNYILNKNLTAYLQSGNCTVSNLTAQNISIETQTGDVTITGSTNSQLKVITFCGDITVKMTDDITNYHINAQSDSGEVHINDIVDAAVEYGSGKKKLLLSTDSGDIIIS